MTKTEDLQILITVYDAGSFSAAAVLLNCPVAKVTRAIQRLEAELETTLFHRTTRKISITDEGLRFVEKIRAALDTIEQAEEALKADPAQPEGVLRVDAASPFLLHQVIPHVRQFKKQFPKIHLELISSEGIIDLIERRTDVAIRIGKLSDSNLHYQTLGRSELKLVASPDYLSSHLKIKSIDDLAAHVLIGFAETKQLNQWPLRKSVDLTFDLLATSGESILQLCLAGNGIALLSDFMTQESLKNGQLIEILPGSIESPNSREEINAVYYSNTVLSNRVQAFLNFFGDKFSL